MLSSTSYHAFYCFTIQPPTYHHLGTSPFYHLAAILFLTSSYPLYLIPEKPSNLGSETFLF